MGQKQLVCLGRAILLRPQIIIMDEATANVDLKTDEFIQKTIRESFAKVTVILIAHRLATVIEAERILVMDQGRLVEYDHPFRLLQDEQGAFTQMVRVTGEESARHLKKRARESYYEQGYCASNYDIFPSRCPCRKN